MRDGHAGIMDGNKTGWEESVGVDGVTRVVDFGVAKAAGGVQATEAGQIKGKVAYMPPEQILSGVVDRRTDIFAMGIVLWEALTGDRLFEHRLVTPEQLTPI